MGPPPIVNLTIDDKMDAIYCTPISHCVWCIDIKIPAFSRTHRNRMTGYPKLNRIIRHDWNVKTKFVEYRLIGVDVLMNLASGQQPH